MKLPQYCFEDLVFRLNRALKAEINIKKGTLDFIASVDPIERRKDL